MFPGSGVSQLPYPTEGFWHLSKGACCSPLLLLSGSPIQQGDRVTGTISGSWSQVWQQLLCESWFCENRNTIIWPPMGELEKTMPREPHSRKNVLEAPTSWQRWLRLHLASSILPLSQKVGEQLCKVSQRISCFHCILWGNQRPSILRGNSVFYFFIQGKKKNPLWIVSYSYWSSSLESGVRLCDGCLGSSFSCLDHVGANKSGRKNGAPLVALSLSALDLTAP